MQKTQLLYATDWQLKAKMVWANELYVVAPRGTGKTEEILAQRALECAIAMPKGKGAMIAVSYKKLKTQLLPPLIKAWKTMGYIRGKHFFVGNDPRPKSWKIEEPYIAPIDYQDFIQFSNGHGIHLISQDRAGMANGLSVEWIAADEARLMNKERYDEDASAILRGHEAIFNHLPQYNSITMTTDMPLIEDGQWILEMQKEMNQERVDAIFELAISREMRLDEANLIIEAGKKPSRALLAEINSLKKMTDELRKDTVQYVEVSDGSNLIFLGKKFILTQMRVMAKHRFGATILGIRPVGGPGFFYPAFDVNKHGYYDSNHEFLNSYDASIEHNILDCRSDSDWQANQPLIIAFDHNSAINCLGVAQIHGNTHKTLKSFYVLGREGKLLQDVLKEFVEYYFFFPGRSITYIYDHTSVCTDASSNQSFKDEICLYLRKAGWNVREFYIGQAFSHDAKFKFIRSIHAGREKFRSMINRDNNEKLIEVLETTKGTVSGDKWQKDKKKEKQVETFAQENAPHLSDMYDLLLLGGLQSNNLSLSFIM